MVTSQVAVGARIAPSATIAVSGEPPRSEPSGAMPPVTVIRIRARSTRSEASVTASAPALI